MNLNSITNDIQREINLSFMNFLKRKYPDREWDIVSFTGEITVDANKDEGYEAMVDSLEPQWVESHERQNKEGGVSIVKGYWKQPKPLTAMDMAVIEVNSENGGNTGLNIEAELEAFVDAMTSGTISLGNINFKG